MPTILIILTLIITFLQIEQDFYVLYLYDID